MAKKTAKQQLILAASAAFFLGSTAITSIHLFNNAAAEPTAPTAELPSLQQQAQGYEIVLQREPDNQTALEGLVQTRMALGDRDGATVPLAQLIRLNPQQQYYKDWMQQIRSGSRPQNSNPLGGSAALPSSSPH